MTAYIYSDELYHYGVKGQKWGVRRYQYKDMSLTPEGYIHYGVGQPNGSSAKSGGSKSGKTEESKSGKSGKTAESANDHKGLTDEQKAKLKKYAQTGALVVGTGLVLYGAYKINKEYDQQIAEVQARIDQMNTGLMSKYGIINSKNHDTYLDVDTNFQRIQSSDKFEDFPFYATYKNHDIKEYAGLFGKNLQNRANYDTRKALKEAEKTGDYDDYNAKKERSDNIKIYQLSINNTSKLKIPSEKNAISVTKELLGDQDFATNLKESMKFAQTQMKRPGQQLLFKEALSALNKEGPLSKKQSESIYKALNLTLTFHNDADLHVQDKFYGELKKRGYAALPDLNDKDYSSYHAKSPVIIFDTQQVKLNSVSSLNEKDINRYYNIYNTERMAKEVVEQTLGTVTRFGSFSVNQASQYVNSKVDTYLNTR